MFMKIKKVKSFNDLRTKFSFVFLYCYLNFSKIQKNRTNLIFPKLILLNIIFQI